MITRVIKDWLAEYKSLSKEELHSYASSIRQYGELITSLYSFFDESPPEEELDPVCHQLYEFYRSKEHELRRFALEFLPTLIWLYMSLLSRGNKNGCGGVEALLLGAYNLETVDVDGKPRIRSFRIPSFSQHSIYHEPSHISSAPLTETLLSRYSQTEPICWKSGPYPQYESINGSNRHDILALLMQCYNSDIPNLSTRSHRIFCKICSRIVTTGFSNLKKEDDDDDEDDLPSMSQVSNTMSGNLRELLPRIPVSPFLLIEMLSGLYFALFNGQAGLGGGAVDDIHYRASYELYADVLLVTNAIRNSLRDKSGGQPEDGPIGLALSPATSYYTLSKTAITNASFRAKKLPDDIPVQPDTADSASKLPTIEENEDTPKANTKFKDRILGKKGDKSKVKESKRETESSIHGAGVVNGDTVDSFQVSVQRGQSRTIVDSVEMQNIAKSASQTRDEREHRDHKEQSSYRDGPNPSSLSGKLVSSLTKSSSSGGKPSGLSKDKTNKLMTHHRNSSGGSVSSENYSTDL
ncbi:hypothetical protein ACJMK2_014190 [Sinanodonta woodiana]|uniref:Hyccin n=1 Tax=Sinanodonta woodiana TaxID=1069815 RepID=A0ABD3V0N9_SINWO